MEEWSCNSLNEETGRRASLKGLSGASVLDIEMRVRHASSDVVVSGLRGRCPG